MKIEINNTASEKIDLDLIKKITTKFFQEYSLTKKEVSIAFVSEEKIKKLNKKYRQIDKVTDVLSFSGEDDFLGELILNLDQIKRQANKFGHGEQDELLFILVHGLLHLIGYDDESEEDEEEMRKIGDKFLNNFKSINF